MSASTDHAATDGDALGVEAGDISYAALLDRHAAEEPITDDMVRRACLRMDSSQSWPFAAAPTGALARLFRSRR